MATIKEWNDIRAVVEAAIREDNERDLADVTNRLEELQRAVEHHVMAMRCIVRDNYYYEYNQILGVVKFGASVLDVAHNTSQIDGTLPSPFDYSDDIPY